MAQRKNGGIKGKAALKPLIREAKPQDAADIRLIYAPYITDSSYTFETELPELSEFRRRIAEYSAYGFFVLECAGEVVAYAYASRHRERKAYQWCCEVSVYCRSDFQRQGWASKLYKKLFAHLKKKNLINAYAGITLPNAPSVGFHEKMGFRKIAHYPDIGFKLGHWHDVGWWELKLGPARKNPPQPQIGGQKS